MVASLGISLFIFPRVLIRQQLAPAVFGEKIDQFFPGFNYISRKVFFITSINGHVAIDDPVLFSRLTRDDLQNFQKPELQRLMIKFSLPFEKGTTTIEMMIDALSDHYASDNWNPIDITGEIDALYKVVIYGALVIFLYILQFFNVIFYILWLVIMFLRLPVVLFLMIFHSSTKLIFFKRSWNKIIYLWTLDETKLKPVDDKHVDLELLHSMKEHELILEVFAQFILQLVNAALKRAAN